MFSLGGSGAIVQMFGAIPGVNTLSRSGDEGNLLALHPTVKPVAMIADAILDCSAPGDIVLDNFSGVGSTILAAEGTGRTCYAIEIDPVYVDTAVMRWEKKTGKMCIRDRYEIDRQAAEVNRFAGGIEPHTGRQRRSEERLLLCGHLCGRLCGHRGAQQRKKGESESTATE